MQLIRAGKDAGTTLQRLIAKNANIRSFLLIFRNIAITKLRALPRASLVAAVRHVFAFYRH